LIVEYSHDGGRGVMKEGRKIERIREMQNYLGVLNIYILTFLRIFLFILLPIIGGWCGWSLWSKGGSGYLVAVILWLASGLLLFCSKEVVPAYVRDVFGGRTTLTGSVAGKGVTEETGLVLYGVNIKRKVFRIRVHGFVFTVSRRLYDWLSEGDEVAIHYWPHSERVSKVERLSAA